MKRKVIILFIFLFLATSYCYAQPVTSNTLIEKAKEYDGKIVEYQGEVIGDVMIRGDFAWVNINDGASAIGIWLPKDLTKDIVYKGSYKNKGDWLEIEGIFNRACAQHGGDMDIHASALRIVVSGQDTPEKADPIKKNIAFVLIGVLCLGLILNVLRRK